MLLLFALVCHNGVDCQTRKNKWAKRSGVPASKWTVAQEGSQQEGKSRWSVEHDRDVRLTFLCYHVKSKHSGSFIITTFGDSSMLQMPWQLFQQVCDNTANKHGTYKHTFSHQSISHGTYKHSLYTPRHCYMVHTNMHFTHQSIFHRTYNIHFAHQSILRCTHKTFILHTSLQDPDLSRQLHCDYTVERSVGGV